MNLPILNEADLPRVGFESLEEFLNFEDQVVSSYTIWQATPQEFVFNPDEGRGMLLAPNGFFVQCSYGMHDEAAKRALEWFTGTYQISRSDFGHWRRAHHYVSDELLYDQGWLHVESDGYIQFRTSGWIQGMRSMDFRFTKQQEAVLMQIAKHPDSAEYYVKETNRLLKNIDFMRTNHLR